MRKWDSTELESMESDVLDGEWFRKHIDINQSHNEIERAQKEEKNRFSSIQKGDKIYTYQDWFEDDVYDAQWAHLLAMGFDVSKYLQ